MEAFIKAKVRIRASKEQVWDALVNPEMTTRYMYGCRVVSDWQPGSKLDWVGVADGKDITYVTGFVKTFDPGTQLVYSVTDPFASYPQTEDNHLLIDCSLSEVNGITELSIVQGDYTKVAEGEKRYGDGAEGWGQLLGTIKKLIESGDETNEEETAS